MSNTGDALPVYKNQVRPDDPSISFGCINHVERTARYCNLTAGPCLLLSSPPILGHPEHIGILRDSDTLVCVYIRVLK